MHGIYRKRENTRKYILLQESLSLPPYPFTRLAKYKVKFGVDAESRAVRRMLYRILLIVHKKGKIFVDGTERIFDITGGGGWRLVATYPEC